MPELMSLSDSPGLPHAGVLRSTLNSNGRRTNVQGFTNEEGELEFNGIPVGDYILEEEVPEGYE
jgi:uncharacterized surface anchored protein